MPTDEWNKTDLQTETGTPQTETNSFIDDKGMLGEPLKEMASTIPGVIVTSILRQGTFQISPNEVNIKWCLVMQILTQLQPPY